MAYNNRFREQQDKGYAKYIAPKIFFCNKMIAKKIGQIYTLHKSH